MQTCLKTLSRCRGSLRAAAGLAALVAAGATAARAADWPLTGALGAHDPSIIREGGRWWCFSTGAGLPVKSSTDGLAWQQGTPLFAAELPWWRTYAPNMGMLDVWAPDVHAFGGRVWCYYCVSEFGHNNSAIGLTSCSSLAAGDWRDDGVVISSKSGVDAFNAIDPSLTTDAAGNPWLVYGSWFDGIHLVQLDRGTMKPTGTTYALAQRANGIEGANIVSANGCFYLIVSIDQCCQGVNSTYKIAFGRASAITGPYVDQGGTAMMSGGATVLWAGNSRWKGPGGQSAVQNGGAWIIAYHAYDANNSGVPTLLISDLAWDSGGWPTLVTPGVTVATLAGLAGTAGATDGAGGAARFSRPADIAADAAGNLYVADTQNNAIRRITAAGAVTTLATGFNHPAGVAVDGSGNVYVADTGGGAVRKVTAAGAVTTLASGFNGPSGVAVDGAGTVYVADTLNHVVRGISATGAVSLVAGAAGVSGSADGTGPAARFFGPQGLAVDGSGNLYVADTNNDTIRKIVLASGAVTTVAGQAGIGGGADGVGSQAQFSFPSGLAADAAGNLFVADTDNHTIREITAGGGVVTLAGQMGTAGAADGADGATRFNFPTGLAADHSGNVLVADTNNDTIRAVQLPAAPAITTQPQGQTVMAGASVQFSVVATGRPAPTYQWSFNGAAIAGAMAATYSLMNTQAANAGNYTVTVTNGSGSVTSAPAALTVTASTPPPSGGGGGGGGGGGAPSGWFLVALALLAAGRGGWRAAAGAAGRIRRGAAACFLLPAVAGLAAAGAWASDADARLAQLGKRDAYVHDPSTIVKCRDEYWLFATGMGVDSWHSRNLIHWERGPQVFAVPPRWITDVAADQKGHFWAPDIILQNGRYFLYYAVSSFGRRTSAIALAANPTLDPADPAYHWTDEGIVVQTTARSDYNAIDPSIFRDNDGRLWLALGSFWSGIKLIELDPATGRRIAADSPMYSLAWHESIEAACLYRHGDWYYLFVNWGICCRGVDSTYEIRVGRSRRVTGPYLDREGQDLLKDGGSVFMATERPFIGPGHAGILADQGRYWVSVHFYDGTEKGRPTLAIRPLRWSDDGWPVAGEQAAPDAAAARP